MKSVDPTLEAKEMSKWFSASDVDEKLSSFIKDAKNQTKHAKKLSYLFIGLSPFPVIVTTRIITFLVGNPYKPSFPLLLGRGTTQSIHISYVCLRYVGGDSRSCFMIITLVFFLARVRVGFSFNSQQ